MMRRSRDGRARIAARMRARSSVCTYDWCGDGGSLGTSTAGSVDWSIVSALAIADVDSMVLIRTIVRSRRPSSTPTRLARSAIVGSPPNSRRSCSRAASSSRRTRRMPRGQASRRSASIIAPRTRRSANVSNLIPRASSKRFAASIRPSTPSCTRSPRSIECGIVDAIRRASDSTNGRVATTRSYWAAASGVVCMPPVMATRVPSSETKIERRPAEPA